MLKVAAVKERAIRKHGLASAMMGAMEVSVSLAKVPMLFQISFFAMNADGRVRDTGAATAHLPRNANVTRGMEASIATKQLICFGDSEELRNYQPDVSFLHESRKAS